MESPSSATEGIWPQRIPPARSPLALPLLGYICGLILWQAGLSLGLMWTLLWTAALLALCAYRPEKHIYLVFALCSLCACGGVWMQQIRAETTPAAWESLPPREAELTLQAEHLFQPRWPERIAGIATITATQPHLRELTGHRVSYYLNTPPNVAPDTIVPGARFRALAKLTYLPANPQPEDFELFLKTQDTHLSFRQGEFITMIHPGSGWQQTLLQLRLQCRNIWQQGSPARDRQGDVLAAMLLGEKKLLGEEREHLYQQSGTMHLFAVSGLHVAAVAAVIHSLLSLLRLPTKARALSGLMLLWIYVGITGSPPSAVRAYLMVLCFWAGRAFVRQHTPFAAYINSALLVLLWDPRQLWMIGFQLSYGVVGGLILTGIPCGHLLRNQLLARPLLTQQRLNRRYQTLRFQLGAFLQATAISFTATIFSTPVIIASFGLFTPGASLINLILLPQAGLTIASGCISLIPGFAGLTFISAFINHSAYLLITCMEAMIEFFLLWQGSRQQRTFDWPPAGALLLLAALILAWRCQPTPKHPWLPTLPLALILTGVWFGTDVSPISVNLKQ